MPESWEQPWQVLRPAGATRHVTVMQAAAEVGTERWKGSGVGGQGGRACVRRAVCLPTDRALGGSHLWALPSRCSPNKRLRRAGRQLLLAHAQRLVKLQCLLPAPLSRRLQLGVGVFGSGPLMEGELLKGRALAEAATMAPHLRGIEVGPAKGQLVGRCLCPRAGTAFLCVRACALVQPAAGWMCVAARFAPPPEFNHSLCCCRLQGTGPRLLQLARSTPGLLATLVGHKSPANVEANGALSKVGRV